MVKCLIKDIWKLGYGEHPHVDSNDSDKSHQKTAGWTNQSTWINQYM